MGDSPFPIPMIPTLTATGHPNQMPHCDEEPIGFDAISEWTGQELDSFLKECDLASENVRDTEAQAATSCAGYPQNPMPEISQPVAVHNAAPGFGSGVAIQNAAPGFGSGVAVQNAAPVFGLSGAVHNTAPGFGSGVAVQNAYVECQKVGACIVSTINMGPCKVGPYYNQGKGHQSSRDPQIYQCGYCGTHKMSASMGKDGRVRIRCGCGGQKQDGHESMHMKWIPLPHLSAAIVAHPHTIVDASMPR